jgi:hypothetical protein
LLTPSEGLGRGFGGPWKGLARPLPLKCTRLCREVGGQVRAGKQGVSAETAVFKTNKILTPLTSMIDGYRVVIAQEAKPEVMPCEGLA